MVLMKVLSNTDSLKCIKINQMYNDFGGNRLKQTNTTNPYKNKILNRVIVVFFIFNQFGYSDWIRIDFANPNAIVVLVILYSLFPKRFFVDEIACCKLTCWCLMEAYGSAWKLYGCMQMRTIIVYMMTHE